MNLVDWTGRETGGRRRRALLQARLATVAAEAAAAADKSLLARIFCIGSWRGLFALRLFLHRASMKAQRRATTRAGPKGEQRRGS